jgi:hypothetical protein
MSFLGFRNLWPLFLLSAACSGSSGGGGFSGQCAQLAQCCTNLDASLRPTCETQLESLSQSADPEQSCGAAYQSYSGAGLCGASGAGGTGASSGSGGFGAFGGFAGAAGGGGIAGSAGATTGGAGGFGAGGSGGVATGGTGGFGAGGSGGVATGGTGGFGAGGSGGVATGGTGGGGGVGRLLFSEYVEGTSNNKALELLNVGGTAVDLSTCELRRYSNGGSTPFSIEGIKTGGVLAPGKTFVICHSQISSTQKCDQLTSSINHNGNDAYEVACAALTHDVFGQIGFDPVTAWGSGSATTLDQTLRRKCGVTQGHTNGTSSFNPALEWTPAGLDVLSDLGLHCGK